MTPDMPRILAEINQFWETYGALIIGVTALILASALVTSVWKFLHKRENRAHRVARLSALLTMIWTSHGLVDGAHREWGLPWEFLLVGFAVFEAMLLAAALKAEENRELHGTPGLPGFYAFMIAALQGFIVASLADQVGLVALRIGLPLFSVGLWWILLTAPRPGDLPEWKEAREQRKRDREATLVWTPATIGMALGILRPGKQTLSDAQAEARIDKMAALAHKIYLMEQARQHNRHQRGSRRLNWRKRRLAKLAREASPEMVQRVRAAVDQAASAVDLMVPATRSTGTDMVHRILDQNGPTPGPVQAGPASDQTLDHVDRSSLDHRTMVQPANGAGPGLVTDATITAALDHWTKVQSKAPASPAPAGAADDGIAETTAKYLTQIQTADLMLAADEFVSGQKVFELALPGARNKTVANRIAAAVRHHRATRDAKDNEDKE